MHFSNRDQVDQRELNPPYKNPLLFLCDFFLPNQFLVCVFKQTPPSSYGFQDKKGQREPKGVNPQLSFLLSILFTSYFFSTDKNM